MNRRGIIARKVFLLSALLLMMLTGVCACGSQTESDTQSVSASEELHAVAGNICLKTGTDFNGGTVLDSVDFIGFSYKYDESRQEYLFTFKLTDEGQDKMGDATTKLAETSGYMSLWVGDELIASPEIMEPVAGDVFALTMAEAGADNISGIVDKLEGKRN